MLLRTMKDAKAWKKPSSFSWRLMDTQTEAWVENSRAVVATAAIGETSVKK
jgi:hypothetical protein